MPDALPLPEDLIVLQRRRLDAETAVAEYTHAVETRRRAEFPGPEQIVERRTWSPEETAEYERLREERDVLIRQVREHPTLQQALAERCWPQTWEALQDACRADA